MVVALAVGAVLNLEVADHTASVVAGCTGVVGFACSSIALLREKASRPGDRGSVDVQAVGVGAIAAGGDITGNAIGAASSVIGSRHPHGDGRDDSSVSGRVVAEGDRALGAIGDISNNAVGPGSSRRSNLLDGS